MKAAKKAKRLAVSAAGVLIAAVRMAKSGVFRLLAGSRPFFCAVWGRLTNWPVSGRSLRLRLSVFFTLLLLVAWLMAALFAWKECRDYIDEFFDSQQMLFAKTLATADFRGAGDRLPKTRELLPGVGKKALGDLEDEAIGFAVFSSSGRMVMTDGQKGRRFVFSHTRGFSNVRLAGKDDVWRIVWLDTPDGNHVVAVGQEVDYRREMALDMLEKQIMPWALLLPVLLLGLYVLLTRELAPLRAIAANLRARAPEDTTQLDIRNVPSEVLPIAQSLNGFFARTNAMLTRERSFISDAAHELRTPLAGLRIQAQVAAREDIAGETRNEALAFLRKGIDRCSRLVEQLLALSRLDALHAPGASSEADVTGLSSNTVAWASLLEELAREYRSKLEQRGIVLDLRISSLASAAHGYPALLTMLLRNLFENAARYTPDQGRIRITLDRGRLVIENDCEELPEAYMPRLGERFFRPPGQEQSGSGLGLSIVNKIADLHGFGVAIRTGKNTEGATTFTVTVTWRQSDE